MTSIADKLTPQQRTFITFAAMLATLMVQIDTTVANVALPDIQSSLGASQDQIAWILTSYMIASAIGIPLAGALLSRFGFRQLYIFGIAIFTGASVLCGFASSLSELVMYRAAQGLAGAAFLPLVQTLMYDIYPRDKIGSAMAIFGIGMMLGPVLGPTLGGYLTDEAGWRWIFFINFPVGVLSWAGMMVFMPRTPPDHSQPFDFLGFGLLAVSLASTQLLFDRGPSKDWFESDEILTYLVIALSALYMFIVQSAHRRDPFFDNRLFRDRNFVSALTVNLAIGPAMFAPMTIIPLFLQGVQAHNAFQTGLVLLPRAIAMVIPMQLIGRLGPNVDMRPILFGGLTISALGVLALQFLSADSPTWVVVAAGSLQAMGLGCTFVPLNLIAFATLSAKLRPMASSLLVLTRNIGASVGLALVMLFVSDMSDSNYAQLLENLSIFNPNFSGAGPWGTAALYNPAMLKYLTFEVLRQATVIAYDHAFRLIFIFTIATAPLVLLLKRRPVPDEQRA